MLSDHIISFTCAVLCLVCVLSQFPVLITGADTFTFLALHYFGIRKLEAFFATLIAIMCACFFVNFGAMLVETHSHTQTHTPVDCFLSLFSRVMDCVVVCMISTCNNVCLCSQPSFVEMMQGFEPVVSDYAVLQAVSIIGWVIYTYTYMHILMMLHDYHHLYVCMYVYCCLFDLYIVL